MQSLGRGHAARWGMCRVTQGGGTAAQVLARPWQQAALAGVGIGEHWQVLAVLAARSTALGAASVAVQGTLCVAGWGSAPCAGPHWALAAAGPHQAQSRTAGAAGPPGRFQRAGTRCGELGEAEGRGQGSSLREVQQALAGPVLLAPALARAPGSSSQLRGRRPATTHLPWAPLPGAGATGPLLLRMHAGH